MTVMLDLLERRGWIRRVPNPDDRRSVLIEITPEGRATANSCFPGIRTVERSILSALTPGERSHLLDLLAKFLARTAEAAAPNPRTPPRGQRIRPGRLTLRQDTEPGAAPASSTLSSSPPASDRWLRHDARTVRDFHRCPERPVVLARDTPTAAVTLAPVHEMSGVLGDETGLDQAGLVGEDDGLDPVPQCQLPH